MLNFTTNIPALDTENEVLFKASAILEKIGNEPGLTANEFHVGLALSDTPAEEFQALTMAAISIETMMGLDMSGDEYEEPTIH